MRRPVLLLLCALTACAASQGSVEPRGGLWSAWLDSPGGRLPFGLELVRGERGPEAFLINGPERLAIERVTLEGRRLELRIEHYDSTIEARLSGDGDALEGRWWKTAGPDRISELPFHAVAGQAPGFEPPGGAASGDASPIDGRWSVDFESDELPAVGVFEAGDAGSVTATFLTATGDYRYLAGRFDGDRLRLSVFDGAHAFLFDARLEADGTLRGDFWSRDSWHESWTARRDPAARLPDALAQTRAVEKIALADLAYPDLDGRMRSLADPEFAGRARVLVVFGSWCPNCNDASAYLVELDRRYRERGLAILGLTFEMTGVFARDAEQVRGYAAYHGIEYPVLIGGVSDKSAASAAFPLIDRVRSYPTFIFIDAESRIRAIHSGFTGPATGAAYVELRATFENLIERMLGA